MKSMAKTRILTGVAGVALVGAAVVGLGGGCELLVDFNRSLIDSGTPLPDGTVPDGGTGDASDTGIPDTGTADAHDSGTPDTGKGDSGMDSGMDAGMPALTITSPTGTTDFGMVVEGGSSGDTQFTVKNTGGATTTAAVSVALSGTNPSQFTIDTANNTCTAALAAGATCNFSVKFTPQSSLGADAGSVTAMVTASAGSASASANLQGEPVAPNPNLSLTAMTTADFGNVEYGVTSSALVFVLTNTGNVTTGMPAAPVISGANAGDFAVSNNGCTAALAPNGTCNISVTFAPMSVPVGLENASISVTASPGGTTAPVTLSGTGTSALTITGTPTDFGTVTVGVASSTLTFTVTNTGSVTTGVPAFSFGGNTDYHVITNNCQSAIPPTTGNTCTVVVGVTAAAAGSDNATLAVAATPGGTATIDLTATADDVAVLSLTPSSQSFTANAGQSQSQTFTITNTATAPAFTSGTPTIHVSGAADFSLGTNGCTAGVAVGTPCTFTVVYAPANQTTSAETGSISVTATPGATTALTSSLSGTSTGITYAPTSQDFGGVGDDGGPGVQNTFTLTNNMSVATGALGAAQLAPGTGTAAGDFTIMTDGCMGMSLGATGSGTNTCSIVVLFNPGSAGSKSATITTTAAAPGGSASFSVTGTGE